MRALIIEDEKLAANRLARLILKNHPSYEIVHTIDTVRDSVAYLKSNESMIDVIFCDIHLADGISFDIFDQVSVQIPIIFTTAYDEYTLKAFDLNSVHYLLKPIDEGDLNKAIKKLESFNEDYSYRDLQTILSRFGKDKTRRFLLKSGQRLVPKKETELAYFFSQNKVVHAADIQQGKVYMTDFTLEQLESELLSQHHFFRINRKQIVNKDAIATMRPYKNQRLSLSLIIPSKEELVLSREKVNHFKEWFTSH